MSQTPDFVDRQKAIELFEDLLQFTPPNGEHPNGKPFLHFWGMGGMGKSWLIAHLEKKLKLEYKHVPYVKVTFDPAQYSPPVFNYTEERLFRRVINKLCPDDKTAYTTYEQKYDRLTDGLREKMKKEKLSRIDYQDFLQESGKSLFYGTIENISQQKPEPILIIVDALDYVVQTGSEHVKWFINVLVDIIYRLPGTRFLLSSREQLSHPDLESKCEDEELKRLEEHDIGDYLGTHDTTFIENVYRFTGGYPLSVGMVKDLYDDGLVSTSDLETQDFQNTYWRKMSLELLFKRFLDRTPDPLLKSFIRKGGIFRHFGYNMLQKTVIPELKPDDFDRFVRYSFIQPKDPYYSFHSELQRVITKYYLKDHPEEFRQDCETIYSEIYKNVENDEKFYYGFYGKIENIFEDWIVACHQYAVAQDNEKLSAIIDIIDEIQKISSDTFSSWKHAIIWFVKGMYEEQSSRTFFALTDFSFEFLKDKGLPDELLTSLQSLKDEEFIKKDEFSVAVEDQIGEEQFKKYEKPILTSTSKWGQAIGAYQKSKKLCDKKDLLELGIVDNNLGVLYFTLDEGGQALKRYRESEEKLKSANNQICLGILYTNMGFFYANDKSFTLTAQFFKELHDENVPQNILERLKPFENKEFTDKESFRYAIAEQLEEFRNEKHFKEGFLDEEFLTIFKFTEESLINLSREPKINKDIPDILQCLENLENQAFTTHEEFLIAVKNHIDDKQTKQTDKYKDLFLKHAKSFRQALIDEQIGRYEELSREHVNNDVNNARQQKRQHAIEYYEQSRQLLLNTEDQTHLAWIDVYMGDLCSGEEWDKALELYEKSKMIFEREDEQQGLQRAEDSINRVKANTDDLDDVSNEFFLESVTQEDEPDEEQKEAKELQGRLIPAKFLCKEKKEEIGTEETEEVEESTMQKQFPADLQKRIVNFLTNLPNMYDKNSWQAFINSAGLDQDLSTQINYGGTTAQFFQLLVSTLINYGTLQDGRHALIAVLEAAKDLVGQLKKNTCFSLIHEVKEFLNEEPQVPDTPTPPSVEPDDILEPPKETMHSISTQQNEDYQLERLAAQRQMYSTAKTVKFWRTMMTVPFAVVLAIGLTLLTRNEIFVLFGGAAIVIIDILLKIFEDHIHDLAAKTQELFDCEALRLDWHDALLETRPAPDDIREYALKYVPDPKHPLENWYDASVDDLHLLLGRIVCQRSNLTWDKKLRWRYVRLVIIDLALLFGVIIVGGILFHYQNLNAYSFAIAALGPAVIFSIQEIYKNIVAIININRLRQKMYNSWDQVFKGKVTKQELMQGTRTWQDEIYLHRKKSPLIFDWFYDRYRKTDIEGESSKALVEEARREIEKNPQVLKQLTI